MSENIDEDQAFADLIATIIDRRRKQGLALIPDWIAAEANHEAVYRERYPWRRAQEHGRAEERGAIESGLACT